MKFFYATASIVALILLQACSSPSVKSNKSLVVSEKSDVADVRLIKAGGSVKVIKKRDNYLSGSGNSITVPEAQIIRELYQSGCMIEDIEINRRKQQMRISCANDKPFGSSI